MDLILEIARSNIANMESVLSDVFALAFGLGIPVLVFLFVMFFAFSFLFVFYTYFMDIAKDELLQSDTTEYKQAVSILTAYALCNVGYYDDPCELCPGKANNEIECNKDFWTETKVKHAINTVLEFEVRAIQKK